MPVFARWLFCHALLSWEFVLILFFILCSVSQLTSSCFSYIFVRGVACVDSAVPVTNAHQLYEMRLTQIFTSALSSTAPSTTTTSPHAAAAAAGFETFGLASRLRGRHALCCRWCCPLYIAPLWWNKGFSVVPKRCRIFYFILTCPCVGLPCDRRLSQHPLSVYTLVSMVTCPLIFRLAAVLCTIPFSFLTLCWRDADLPTFVVVESSYDVCWSCTWAKRLCNVIMFLANTL